MPSGFVEVSGYSKSQLDARFEDGKNAGKSEQLGDTNATQAQVLSGKKFASNNALNQNKIDTGTMVNNGAWNYTLNPGESKAVPVGYHSGQGSVTARPNQNSTISRPSSRTEDSTNPAVLIDLGVNNTVRYLNTSQVPNKNTAKFTPSTRADNIDMGATNSYRYVDTRSVPNYNDETYTCASPAGGTDAQNTYVLADNNRVKTIKTKNVYDKGYANGVDAWGTNSNGVIGQTSGHLSVNGEWSMTISNATDNDAFLTAVTTAARKDGDGYSDVAVTAYNDGATYPAWHSDVTSYKDTSLSTNIAIRTRTYMYYLPAGDSLTLKAKCTGQAGAATFVVSQLRTTA